MKTIVLVFLSLFLTKTCQSKKDLPKPEPTTQNAQITEVAQPNEIKKKEPKTEMVEEKTQTGTKIEYEALSRGFYNKVILENNQITNITDRNSLGKGEVYPVSKKDADEILNLVKAIKLETISDLKAPTDARTYDGAAHANISITTNGKKYSGAGFDAGKPPKELESLVTKILSLIPKK